MAAIGNALTHDSLRRAFVDARFEARIRPVIRLEIFNTPG